MYLQLKLYIRLLTFVSKNIKSFFIEYRKLDNVISSRKQKATRECCFKIEI